jgi:hypothetical protein
MAIRPPVESDLAAVAERYGLELSSADIASLVPFASGLVSSWTAVEELYARTVRPHGATAGGSARLSATTRSERGT